MDSKWKVILSSFKRKLPLSTLDQSRKLKQKTIRLSGTCIAKEIYQVEISTVRIGI